MATQLKGHEKWDIWGSWKTSMTVAEMAEYVAEKNGGGSGVTIEEVNTAIDSKIETKADKSSISNVNNTSDADKPVSTAQKAALDLKADKSLVPTKTEMTAAIKVVEDDANAINEQVGINTTAINGLGTTQVGQATAIKKLQDEKVNLAGLLKTIDATPAQVHTGETEVDVFKLDYGQHLIRTNNAINTPPDTTITLIEVIKTHDEVGGGTGIKVLLPTDFEQGTISESSSVGTEYNLAKYPPTEPLHGSRIRNTNPIEINEFSTVSVADGYQYCVLAFDENQKYLGRSTFLPWDSSPRLTFPDAKFIAVAVKHYGTDAPISPTDATAAKLTITTLGSTSGGSKLLIAWGATVGDLHTCVNIAGAWSNWRKIGTQLPQDAEEGSTLAFKGGKWVAVPPVAP